MIFATLKELYPHENRVAASVEVIKRIVESGHRFLVESGAGNLACLSDDQMKQAGAEIVSSAKEIYQKADVIFKIWAPLPQEIKYLKEEQIIIAYFKTYNNQKNLAALAEKGVIGYALNLLPRTSRAQSMDILSSQSSLAGYKAVVNAVALHKKAAPMMMTAAGTVAPIKVLILGAGVAGLQAIATAKRLGAVVYASDVRKEVKEQVESLGGRFLDVSAQTQFSDASGYATETTAEYQKRQQEAVAQQLLQTDIVITTAQLPGRAAPRLISKEMLRHMPKGGIVMDMAADSGGNVEGSVDGKSVDINGVTVIGCSNLASEVAATASALFAKNMLNFANLAYHADSKQFDFNVSDELVQKTCICKNYHLTENVK